MVNKSGLTRVAIVKAKTPARHRGQPIYPTVFHVRPTLKEFQIL